MPNFAIKINKVKKNCNKLICKYTISQNFYDTRQKQYTTFFSSKYFA